MRVVAQNEVGSSEPLQTTDPIVCETPGASGSAAGGAAPGQPEGPLAVKGMSSNSVTLSWEPPVEDGGSPITGYLLAKRDMHSKIWEDLDPVPEYVNEFTVPYLRENKRYMFRVAATNANGTGEWLQTMDVVHVKRASGLFFYDFIVV